MFTFLFTLYVRIFTVVLISFENYSILITVVVLFRNHFLAAQERSFDVDHSCLTALLALIN